MPSVMARPIADDGGYVQLQNILLRCNASVGPGETIAQATLEGSERAFQFIRSPNSWAGWIDAGLMQGRKQAVAMSNTGLDQGGELPVSSAQSSYSHVYSLNATGGIACTKMEALLTRREIGCREVRGKITQIPCILKIELREDHCFARKFYT